MRSWSRSLAIGAVVLGLACGGDSGGPIVPKTLLLISGDDQTGGIGLTLAEPLVVIVLGSDSKPYANATVAWAVTSGVATLNPASSVSDVNGRASTAVTFASTTGGVTITATVTGLTPVTFTATVVAPGSLAIASGDAQTGPSSGALALPLKVTLLSTNSDPYPGATVTWAVASGSATLNPTSSVTDAAGEAATTVQLGVITGQVLITASVTGVTPVTFTLTAVHPCLYVAPYSFGVTTFGSLSGTDCLVSIGAASYYYDYYGLTIPSGQQSLTIGLASTAFNAWLELYKASGLFSGVDDDESAQTTNSRINAILGAGNYVIGVSTYNDQETGTYALSSGARAATVAGCQNIFITRGITLSETVLAADCNDTTVSGVYFSDRLLLALDSGDVFEARLQSVALDPYLFLYDLFRQTVVAFNDDSASGITTSYLYYTSDTTSFFLLDVGTASVGQTGAYTLTITGPAATTAALRIGGGAGAPALLPSRPPPRALARSLREYLDSSARRSPGRP